MALQLTRRSKKWLVISILTLVGLCVRVWFIDNKKKQDFAQKILYFQKVGIGPQRLVLFHGLLGSHHYWEPIPEVLVNFFEILSLDLLGFGESPKPKLAYTPSDHVQAIQQTLVEAKFVNEKFFLIGHSMGALLAMNYAIAHPESVRGLVLINPPIVTADGELKKNIEGSTSKVMVAMTFNKFWGGLVCHAHEFIPFLSYPLVRILEPDLPIALAKDSTKHSWESFSGSLDNVIRAQRFFELIDALAATPILVVSSVDDTYSNEDALKQLQHHDRLKLPLLTTKSIAGGHNFRLAEKTELLKAITEFTQAN